VKIRQFGETVRISDLKELGLANAASFGAKARSALAAGVKKIIVDLSATGYVDCGGLGALLALRKDARHHNCNVSIRVVNPTPPVLRMIQLTRLGDLVENTQNRSSRVSSTLQFKS
jgi:anti-sigma B factor antagonist